MKIVEIHTMSFEGGCLCGAVRYQISRSRLNAMHCHCEMCRKAHGTAFSTHVIVRADQLRWLQGDSGLVVYRSSADGFREFCRHCGTHLLVHGQSGDGTLSIPAGTLDGDPQISILGHMFTGARAPWYVAQDDGSPRHAGWPPGFGPSPRE